MRNSAGGGVSPPASAVRAASLDRRVGSLSGPAAHGFRGPRAPQPGLPISPVPRPGPAVPPAPSTPVAVGVCSIRGWLSACRRRVVVLMTPFPPFGDGEITVRGCVVPKVQTTSVKNAENRGVVGEVVCVLGAVVSVVVAVLAAGPLRWQHEPFHAQLNPIGGMVGSLPKPPPIGLTCASMGPGVHLPGLGHHLSG